MGNFKVITQCNFFIVCFFWNMVIFLNAANYSVCCAGQLYVCVYYIALKINKAPFTAICIGIASGRSIPVFIWLQCCPLWWPSRAPPRPPTWSRPGAGPLSAWWRAATPGPQSPGSSTTRSTLQWNMWVESLLFSKPKNQEVQLQFSFSYLVILCSTSNMFFSKVSRDETIDTKDARLHQIAVSVWRFPLSPCARPAAQVQDLFALDSAKSIKG